MGRAAPNHGTVPVSAMPAVPVAASDSHAEYKQVTVLFADVVRSMDIAAAVGAERLREIMAELFDRASAVVQRYGGTVDKFTGDGIMAVFGAPIALEDHALRACLAALDIQTEAAALAAEVQRRDGITLQLRIGLNSGRGDRRRNRFGPNGVHGDRRAGRHGAADGVGGAARRGDGQRVHGATCGHVGVLGETGTGPHQGLR